MKGRYIKLASSKIWMAAFLLLSTQLVAQEVSIKLGKNDIALNEYFTISIQVKNDRLKQYGAFPEIEGFVKRGTSSSSSTNIINGRMSSTQSIVQNYQATRQGDFRLPPFSITINGTEARSSGTSIRVGEPAQRSSRSSGFGRSPFDDFFGRNSAPAEFVDVKADAFVALSVDKDEVYVGEGFTATLAFYVAEANDAEMRFYDLSNQITEIVKKIKPTNCWEENFNIDQIVGTEVTINGKNYDQYKIYQTAFYPLTAADISFPSIGLKMIKYKVAKNPSFFGRNKQEDYETFYSKAKKVAVKELPPHPLKDEVAVGDYRLREKISTEELETGQSFTYHFDIIGQGNISSISAPTPTADTRFDFYTPDIRQNINRGRNRVSGTKSFDFYGIPNEPGLYRLQDYFTWIFFNPDQEKYDTLQSKLTLKVTGESRENYAIASNDLGDFYDQISQADNDLAPIQSPLWISWIWHGLVVLILAFTLYFFLKKPVV